MAEIAVVLTALAAIAWVNWYFLFAGRSTVSAGSGAGGLQEIIVRVAGGYDPSAIRVAAGKPVRLVFDRQETSGCSEEVVFPAFGIRRFLPAHQQTAIEFTPAEPGSYEFSCGMGMLRGRVVAVEGEEE